MAEPARRPSPREQLVGAGKVRLSRHVNAITADQVRAWAAAYQTVHDDLVAAAADAARRAAATGDVANPAAYRTARLSTSLDELGKQLRELGRRQGVTISGLVAPAVTVPVEVQRELFQQAGLAFNLPADRALRAITGRTAQRIAKEYPQLTAAAEQQLRASLVRGIAAGQGPRQAAAALVAATRGEAARALGTTLEEVNSGKVAGAIVEQVRGAFAGGLARANVLVRTELLDASRMATRESYLANPGLVGGWRWLSARDRRTCPACWGMHNSVHDVDEVLEGHQQCRCTQVPILAGDDEVDPATGRTLDDVGDPDELLRKLPEADQLEVLGPARYQRWKAGQPLRDFVQRRDNVGWRGSHVVTPLRDLPDAPPPGVPPPPPPRPPAPAPVVDEVPAYVRDVRATLSQLPADRGQIGSVDLAGMDDDAVATLLARHDGILRHLRDDVTELDEQVGYWRGERTRLAQLADRTQHQELRLGEATDEVARLEALQTIRRQRVADRLAELRGRGTGVMDVAADGGPGPTGERHLAVIREAGRRLAAELDEQLDAIPEVRAARARVAEFAALDQQLRDLEAELVQLRRRGLAIPGGPEWTERAAAIRALREQARELGVQVRPDQALVAKRRRDTALALLEQVRTMGRRGTLQLRAAGTREVQAWLTEALRHAETYYPQAWLDRAGSRTLHLKSVGRGYHQGDTIALSDDLGTRVISDAPRGNRVGIHELGHDMEDRVPGLKRAQWLEHWRRTTDAGARVKSGPNKGHRKRTGDNALRRMEGYGSSEKARRDGYRDAYTGKEYGGGYDNNAELFTTAMESLFAGSKYDDQEVTEWLLGVLAAL